MSRDPTHGWCRAFMGRPVAHAVDVRFDLGALRSACGLEPKRGWHKPRADGQRCKHCSAIMDGTFTQRTGTTKIRENVHPVVREALMEFKRRRIVFKAGSRQAGLNDRALTTWAAGANPSLYNFDAALGVVGLKLAIVPSDQEDFHAEHR